MVQTGIISHVKNIISIVHRVQMASYRVDFKGTSFPLAPNTATMYSSLVINLMKFCAKFYKMIY